MKDYRKINFGKADAQQEGDEFPNLLRDGYYDNDRVVEQAYGSSKYLFLGYKGSGKSALSVHLKLSAKEDTLVETLSLKDFPYKSFAKIVSGESEIEYKLKVSWRWLLLAQVLYTLNLDNEAKPKDSSELNRLMEFLSQSGIFPLVNISDLVTKTTTKKFQSAMKIFSYEHSTTKENAQISFEWLITFLKRVIAEYKEMHTHILTIDGLDEILTTRDIQYQSIAALINEVKDLNHFFREKNLPLKIIVLCRTDIFEKLPDANKNKIRRDCSYSFTWYKEGEDSQEECGLIDLLNKRGRLVYPDIVDVITEFFPPRILDGEIHTELLEMTRHTPRDFMQLMVSIQSHCTSSKVTHKNITEGIKDYSSEYFLPEIKDELAGYIPYQCIDKIINTLSSFRSREFSYKDFCQTFESLQITEVTPDIVLGTLYDCSAIGHAYPYQDQTRITFKYRNRNSCFSKNNRIILHKGLWKALNINY